MELNLPKDFLKRMEEMLGDEFPLFLEHCQKPRKYGLRVNTLKISCQKFESICPFPIEKIPWIPNGYFYPAEIRPAQHPYYQAGLYYLQEPSAMTPAACLPVTPGEAVLDSLCCAGRKSHRIGRTPSGKRNSDSQRHQHFQGKGPSSKSGTFRSFQHFCDQRIP